MEIGAELKIDSGYLEKLKKKGKFSDKDRLRKVISSWLKQKNGSPIPIWVSLCSAVRARSVDETGLAERMRREQGVVEFQLEEFSQSMVPFNKTSAGG